MMYSVMAPEVVTFAILFARSSVSHRFPSGPVAMPRPIPGAGQLGTVGQPGRIAAGPDGNLWFTQCTWMTAPEVARVTPSGAFTEYRIPFDDIPEACPDGITAGPDGNLWVTMSLGGFVVQLTTAGAITEYTFPGFSPDRFTTFQSNQGGIATGPDGNLWITGPNDVAKIVP
jgi:streptogramin lyase